MEISINEIVMYSEKCNIEKSALYGFNNLTINLKAKSNLISGSPWGATINWNYTGE